MIYAAAARALTLCYLHPGKRLPTCRERCEFELMDKCLRSSCRQTAVESAAYLTLRSGRQVPAAAGSPTRRRYRQGDRCCSKAGAASAGRQRRGRRELASQAGEEDAELPPSQESPGVFRNEGCGGDRFDIYD